MLVHRLQRWPQIETILGQRLEIACCGMQGQYDAHGLIKAGHPFARDLCPYMRGPCACAQKKRKHEKCIGAIQ